ncbi:ComEC/Rec2 family competence protein [Roseovarius amoyensis]|uniref:ComEC/Rec2 family competence protein n=1 Tax=Roseovarius amoyensis TaxID=2211448 RepID=UPI003B82CBA1
MAPTHRPVPVLVSAWLAQRGQLVCWTPAAMAAGIGLYFSLRVEPGVPHYIALGAAGLACAGLAARAGAILAPLLWLPALVALGLCLAGARAHLVAGPVLEWRYYGPVQGRVADIDRSASDALRLTLDRVVLADMPPDRTPPRVRVSLHGDGLEPDIAPGLTVIMTAHLSPPSGPTEPGGFDFRRHAWFQGLGAVGYTRTPVLALAPPEGGQWLFRARMWLSARVQAALPGEAGAFAAAIMTGDRSGIPQPVLEALRRSNLAHLLAISGLHMGLLAGVVLGVVRLGLAAVPALGLRWPAKKIAAVAAIVASAGYLALSGGSIATERAFIMVTVMLCAVLADRRALSLRAVAVAAVIVLALRPEALLGPGFQMSFAATTALVAVFGLIRDRRIPLGPVWLRPAAAVAISSLVAGLATAPFAAAHFNQFAHYGLVANLLSVPLMGVLVMPAALAAVVLLPLGAEAAALWLMGLGLDWILGVAQWVSALPGARGAVPAPGPWVLPLLALGAIFVILWQGRARVAGLAPVVLAMVLWAGAERPEVLISERGGLVGVMTHKGRAISRARGAGFVAGIWLENDGDAADQALAHARWPTGQVADWPPVRALPGKRAAAALDDCAPGEWVVLTAEPRDGLPCRVITPATSRKTGALALYRDGDKLRMISARQQTGTRLWSPGRTPDQ